MEPIKRIAMGAIVAVLISSIAGCFYYRRTDVDDRPGPYPYYYDRR